MSLFGRIKSAIFGSDDAKPAATSASASSTAQASAGGPSSAASSAAPRPAATASATAAKPSGTAPTTASAPASNVDVAAILTQKAAAKGQKLEWRTSIVDLMKLLDLDSSLASRKELAKELGYTADTSDSAAMNMWLHKQVMKKLAESGGKVPEELRA